MIKKIDHVVITIANATECFEFYEKLGFKIVKSANRGEMFGEGFKINVHFLGHELEPHAENVHTGCNDFCFEISNKIEDYKEYLIQQNLEIIEGIVTRHGAFGVMKSLYLKDPDGNLIEFCSYA